MARGKAPERYAAGRLLLGTTMTLEEVVDEYLAQHDAEPETIDKLSWLLAKALGAFGGRRLPELRSQQLGTPVPAAA